MYFDLNISVPPPPTVVNFQQQNKKGKQKPGQEQTIEPPNGSWFSPAQIAAIEARVEILVHLGYMVLAFNQTIEFAFTVHGHINYLDSLVQQLKKREGVIYLKRLTILMDDTSDKRTGLTKNNEALLQMYDILSLHPTSLTTFSAACLTHSAPSTLTTHIISFPLTLPRIPFFFKHTLVRTAIKNGAVFEIAYSPAVGGAGESERRNWWANVRELTRVTRGKGVIFSSGSSGVGDMRGPGDVVNIAALVGFPQDVAKHALSTLCKTIVIRAQTRKTYRAVLSAPILVIPEVAPQPEPASLAEEGLVEGVPPDTSGLIQQQHNLSTTPTPDPPPADPKPIPCVVPTIQGKRSREADGDAGLQNKKNKRRKRPCQ